jgi:hypothetical protein
MSRSAILAPAPNRAECTGKAGATWARPPRTLSAGAQIAFARAIHADRHGRARPRFLRSCGKRRLSLAAAACGTRTIFQNGWAAAAWRFIEQGPLVGCIGGDLTFPAANPESPHSRTHGAAPVPPDRPGARRTPGVASASADSQRREAVAAQDRQLVAQHDDLTFLELSRPEQQEDQLRAR